MVAQQLILNGKDEAGARLGAAVIIGGLYHLAGFLVHVIHALGLPRDAVGPLEAGVEPLGRVGGEALVQNHVDKLVVHYAGLFALSHHALVHQRGDPEIDHAVRDLAHGHLMIGPGDAGAAKILRRDDVDCILGVGRWKLQIPHVAQHASRFVVRKMNVALGPFKQVVYRFARVGGIVERTREAPRDQLVHSSGHDLTQFPISRCGGPQRTGKGLCTHAQTRGSEQTGERSHATI